MGTNCIRNNARNQNVPSRNTSEKLQQAAVRENQHKKRALLMRNDTGGVAALGTIWDAVVKQRIRSSA